MKKYAEMFLLIWPNMDFMILKNESAHCILSFLHV